MAGITTDGRGAAFIPVRVMISIAIGAAIVGLVCLGFQQAQKTSAQSQVERECNRLLSSLSTMRTSGDARNIDNPFSSPGERRAIQLELSSKLSYIGFGVNPDDDHDGYLESGLTSNGSCIFYKVEGMSEQVIWDVGDIKFREGEKTDDRWTINQPSQGYVIKGGGTYRVTFELVRDASNTKYVLIRANDDINP